MLSDVGSKVIRAFGILNTNVPEDHKMMHGMPWPGEYLIAPDGAVRDKLFLRNYEYRPSASQVVLRNASNYNAGSSVRIDADVLDATITLSTDRCFPGQELGVALSINIKPGWHIYGRPLPDNYQPTELTFDSEIIDEQSLEFPAPKTKLLKALGENLSVYEGEFRAIGKLRIRWSPPIPAKFLEPLGKKIEPGLHKIGGTLRFQACSDDVCEMPQTIKFELPITIKAGVPAAPKQRV
jgi:hypothetical protein